MSKTPKMLPRKIDSQIKLRHNGDLIGDVCVYVFVNMCRHKVN